MTPAATIATPPFASPAARRALIGALALHVLVLGGLWWLDRRIEPPPEPPMITGVLLPPMPAARSAPAAKAAPVAAPTEPPPIPTPAPAAQSAPPPTPSPSEVRPGTEPVAPARPDPALARSSARQAARALAAEQARERETQAALLRQQHAQEAAAAEADRLARARAAALRDQQAAFAAQHARSAAEATRLAREKDEQARLRLAADAAAKKLAQEQAETRQRAQALDRAARQASEDLARRQSLDAELSDAGKEAQRRRTAQTRADEDELARRLTAEGPPGMSPAQRRDLTAQWVGAIQARIRQQWFRPPGVETTACRIAIRQDPGGRILDVRLLSSCGGGLSDDAVERAVRLASPLPPPPSPEIFDPAINITFRPG